MGILDLFRGGSFRAPEKRAMSQGVNPPSRQHHSERGVNVNEALTLSMVYRAINIHAVSAKQLSIDVYRNDVRVPSPLWVRQPDSRQSRSAFIEQTVVSMATSGNAYWEIFRDNQNRIVNLRVLNPLEMLIDETNAGRVTGYRYQDRYLTLDQVKHLTLMRVPGTNIGLGPIQAASQELRGVMDTRNYAANFFTESGIPSGVLKSDQVLSPDQAQAAKEAWNQTAGARNGTAVLGSGLTYQAVLLSPQDVQFLETRQFNVTEVARLFGVPASLMLTGAQASSMTYQNIESEHIAYVRFSLMSYLVEIEDAFTSLLPGQQYAKFNIDALLRSDTLTRYQAHNIAIAAGFMTPEEVRIVENLAPNPAEGILNV